MMFPLIFAFSGSGKLSRLWERIFSLFKNRSFYHLRTAALAGPHPCILVTIYRNFPLCSGEPGIPAQSV